MDGLKARLSFDAVAYDYDDEYLTIDTDTHIININNLSRLFGVQYDGNSKLIKFRISNKLSDIQKMQDSIVYINWIDSKGVKGQSIAINKTISNDICEFAWKVPFDALKNSGVLHFAMSAVMTKNSSSVIDQKWSTQIASVITPDGIYIKSYTPSSEEEDRIAQIYNELSKMINKQNDNLQSQVNSLNNDIVNYINGIDFIKDEFVVGQWDENSIDSSMQYVCCTKNKIKYDWDITINIEDGYCILIRYYNTDGSYSKTTGWHIEKVNISKNTLFTISLKKKPDDYSDRPVPEIRKKVLTINSKLSSEYENIKATSKRTDFLTVDFVAGISDSEGNIDETKKYIVTTKNKLKFEEDEVLKVKEGYRCLVRKFDDKGTQTNAVWVTGMHKLNKGTDYLLSVEKTPENFLEIADINLYTRMIYLATGEEHSQWCGKKWYAFGTSMSDTSAQMPYDLPGKTGKYPPFLSQLSGLKHSNYAIRGSTTSNSAIADRNTSVQQIKATDISQADIITLDGLVNDFAGNFPIGNLGDKDDTTIMGALYQFVSYAQENSSAVVVLLTDTSGKIWTTPSGTEHPIKYLPDKKNGLGLFQSDYRQAMIDFARWFGCICIDCGSESSINYLHPEYIQDQLHHSTLGGEQYANTIWEKLKNIEPLVK